MKLDWKKTFLIGLGYLGISVMWQIYNLFVPLFLQAGDPAFDAQGQITVLGFGLSATWSGALMTLDNIAALFILPMIGIWSDRTRTRIGRRYPFILVGAPLAALSFAVIPIAAGMIKPEMNGQIAGNAGAFALFMLAAGVMLLAMAMFRTPVIALMPDLTPSVQRNKANGVINFMGGVGNIMAALGLARLFDAMIGLPFWIGSLLLLVAVGLLYALVREPIGDETSSAADLHKKASLGMVKTLPSASRTSLLFLLAAILAWYTGFEAIMTFFSSYAVTKLGVTAGQAGTLFSVALASFILFSIPAGFVGNRLGRKRTITLGLVVFAALLIVAYLVPKVTVVALVLGIGGAAWALVNINALPMVVEIADDALLLGTFTGFYYLASQLASIVGPLLNGAIVDWAGRDYGIIFVVTPAFFAVALLCMRFVTRGEADRA